MKSLSIEMRPQVLEEVIGHASAKAAIRKVVESGRVPVAWILSGPPGVGKTTLANILARAIQGEMPADAVVDVTTCNGADRNGVDDARAMAEQAQYRPFAGRYKVFILDEAQQLTAAAQNTLLIPCEAKDGTSVFIFCTTDPSKLLPALKSRGYHLELKPLDGAGTRALVCGAEEHLAGELLPAPSKGREDFVEHMVRARVNSPREVLMAYEKFRVGTPLTECVSGAEHEPLYAEVARAVVAGNWNAVREKLSQIKTADVRGLRAVVSAFLRTELLREVIGAKADAISACLIGMGQNFDDGTAYAVTTGIFYRCCKAIVGGKA